MSCSPFDLKDYLLNELGVNDRRQVEKHVGACAGCREELGRLQMTDAALRSLPDEEIPQRIAFVSDPVFEPSPWRRAWQAFWGSSARLGFASAAMLSVALVVTALNRPAPAPAASATVSPAEVARLESAFDQRLHTAVAEAVAESEARQEQKTAVLLRAAEKRYEFDRVAYQLYVSQNLEVMMKKQRRDMMAANDIVASQQGVQQ